MRNVFSVFLLFNHGGDQYYNPGWIGRATDIPTVERITLASQEWDECIYCLTRKAKKHSVISFVNDYMWFTALSSCHQMCVRAKKKSWDWHSRKTRACGLLILILTFCYICLIAQFLSHYLYDLNQLQCWIRRLRNSETVCAADNWRFWVVLKYSVPYIKKKGNLHHCDCVLYCTNWPCQLYMYRYSF